MMTAEVEEIGDISAECVLWTSEDGNDARCELEVSVEDETVGVTCLAQQQEIRASSLRCMIMKQRRDI